MIPGLESGGCLEWMMKDYFGNKYWVLIGRALSVKECFRWSKSENKWVDVDKI